MPYFELKKEELTFPPAYFADIDGLLAVGGTMSVERLLLAYNSGIYYWHYPLKHIKWWSPDPRTVIRPNLFELSQSRLDFLTTAFRVTVDTQFEKVLRACQEEYNTEGQMDNGWLTERMVRMFKELHQMGYAHSVEIWNNHQLVGGLFGIAIGKLFFGEYLFETADNAAEFAILFLIKKLKDEGYVLMDMQKETFFFPDIEHDEIPRLEYVDICKENVKKYGDELPKF
ncbi:leucyl/phenylalanyl-tRNA--protein transferase [Flagellimonas meishanensis]|uniref:leucyl/phenylalanyl-tRNA--protein transferase n=1 Tax=Flagellimonas meishanensis TaxID=2873264 RepID=UPI001CA639ED|nr:leucyl/phenylalanyl-tRNA--protein transferase [[Muricauda] meishanensis]